MEVNEFKIRLSGTANIPRELAIDKTYDLTISNADCKHSEEISNENGTLNKIFKFKITEMSEVNIISENEIITSKKKGSLAQTLRVVLHKLWCESYAGDYPDFELLYSEEMQKIIKKYQDKLV